jgi:Amt family ammonium transporter
MTGGAQGLFFGGGLGLLGKQALAMAVVAAYAFAVSYGLAALIERTMGFRLSAEDEASGVDFTQHAETAYAEGVYGQQPARRSPFGDRLRPGDGDED